MFADPRLSCRPLPVAAILTAAFVIFCLYQKWYLPSLLGAGPLAGYAGYVWIRCRRRRTSGETQDPIDHLSRAVYSHSPALRRFCYMSYRAQEQGGTPSVSRLHENAIFRTLVHPDDRKVLNDARRTALERGGHFEQTYRLLYQGRVQWVRDQGIVVARAGAVEMHGILTPLDDARPSAFGDFPDRRAFLEAIEQNQLTLVYQPQVASKSGELAGFEALLRWHHPQYGAIAPASFIPAAEAQGVIALLGNWVIDRVCEQIAHWQAQGVRVPRVALNLSALQLGGELLTQVRSALSRHGLQGECLEFEITESRLMEDQKASARVLAGLQRLGAQIALDDFGTGYSSLDMLASLPLDRLKIDRRFVTALIHEPHGHAVLEAIVGLAHSLSLEVVAEGVETFRQQHELTTLGCEILQGYLFGAGDTPAEALARLLRLRDERAFKGPEAMDRRPGGRPEAAIDPPSAVSDAF